RPTDGASSAGRTARGMRAHRGRHRPAAPGPPQRRGRRGPMKVGVVGNPRYADLRAVLRNLASEAPARGIDLITEPSLVPLWDKPLPLMEQGPPDALITFGGDGTLLRGARMLRGLELPILGINLGRVGFLTTATREEMPAALDALVSGRYV